MKNWEMLYQRQPIHLDIILFVVALAIHLPLTQFSLRAPEKGTKDKPFSKLVNIDFIEEQIEKRQAKKLILPPKVPDVKKLEDIVQKAKAAQKKLLSRKKPIPPPAPKPTVRKDIITAPTAAKLQEKLQKKFNQNKKILDTKKGFKSNKISMTSRQASQIKMGGASSAALNANKKSFSAPAGGSLSGKSGFKMAKADLPASIGGDDSGLQIGGGNAIVVPVGKRSRGDSSILSPVAKMQDKGSLNKSIGGLASSSGGNDIGLAGGGGGGAIALPAGGRSSGPAVPAARVSTPQKSFLEKQSASSTASSSLAQNSSVSSLPTVSVKPLAKKKKKKPMFMITGPLKDRKVMSRVLPAYPQWARKKGIKTAVTLQFSVTPQGSVKNPILVVRTSGYPRIDKSAQDALKKWKFAPLPEDQFRDEVGSITFNFSIR